MALNNSTRDISNGQLDEILQDENPVEEADEENVVRRRKTYEFYDRTILNKANKVPDFLFRRVFRMTRTTFQVISELIF